MCGGRRRRDDPGGTLLARGRRRCRAASVSLYRPPRLWVGAQNPKARPRWVLSARRGRLVRCRRATNPGSSRERDAAGGARAAEGDPGHHPRLAPGPARGVSRSLEEFGVGPIIAATILCAWSHPGRVHSEAAFAMLAGVAPIPANSGKVTTRYRLNRFVDRHLNTALHTLVQIRIQYQPATRDYVARRTVKEDQPARSNAAWLATVARDLYRLLEGRAATA